MHELRNFILRNSKGLSGINEKFMDLHVKAINASLHGRNAEVFLDGSKWFRRAELFHESGCEFSIIHLIRDPRGFCCSCIKNEKLTKDREGVNRAINAWVNHVRKERLLEKRTGAPRLRVVYEDLCKDTPGQLERICDFMGLSMDGHWHEYTREGVHLTGNRMRFKFDGKVLHDEKWKDFFDASQLDQILEATAPYLEDLDIQLA